MKISKRFLSLMLTALFCISLITTTVFAASYPLMYPKEYEYTVTQGETLKMEFTIFHEFKNEKAHVRVHQGSRTGTIVASSDRDFYNINSMTDYSVTLDTDDVQPGEYVVEYWMSFYSMYDWHEEPTHNFLLKINVKAAPCKNGHNFDNGKVTKAPTCKATGVNTKTCTVCGTKETSSIPKTEHQWDDGTIKVASTSTSAGNKVYTCKVCKETKTEGIPARFNDVDSNGCYAPAIDWAFDKGVTSGTTDNTFSPNDECTRGQVLTFLWRAMGSPNPKTSENPFKDVNSNQYYYKAILWGVEQGITGGTSPTTFSPEETCSYAHILTFIWRSQGKPDFTESGEWYEDALAWSSDNGILEETSATSSIESSCPRKDVVKYLYRILDEEGGKTLQHKFGEWKITKEATCSSEGSKTRTCTECKEKQTETIPMTEHSLANADCTTPSKCTKCKAEVGAAKSHSWIDATCLKAKTCSVCGATEGNALGHTTKNGTCGRCSEYISTPIEYSGHGNDVITNVKVPYGLYKVIMTNSGKEHFSVVTYDENGVYYLLANDSGSSFYGEALYREGEIKATKNWSFEVDSESNWTIKIVPITEKITSNIKGSKSKVTGFFSGTGFCSITMTNSGKEHFSVIIYDDTGDYLDLLANDSGEPYNGKASFKMESGKRYFLVIDSESNWTVDFGKGENLTTYN